MTALSDLLAEHRPRSSHRCACGWEGDHYDVHLHDVLAAAANLPTVLAAVVRAHGPEAVVAGLVDVGALVLDSTDCRQRVRGEVTPEGDQRRWWVEDVHLYRVKGESDRG